MKTLTVATLALLGAVVVTPKLLLVNYCNARLWTGYGPVDTLLIAAQDAFLGACVALLVVWLLMRATIPRLLLAGGIVLGLSGLLLLDCRVRQLWLRPIDRTLIDYALMNLHDLKSGMELFLCHQAGFGLTWRRLAMIVFALDVVALVGAGVVIRRAGGLQPPPWRFAIAGCLVLLLIAGRAPRQRYRLEENALASPLVGLVRPGIDYSHLQARAARCDQPEWPVARTLTSKARRLLPETRPLKNVIVYVLESVRWLDTDPSRESSTHMPTLSRMASEGLMVRTWVSIPHSSKAHYALLTGRHPSPGIEMRESIGLRSSLFRALQRDRTAATFVFSAAHLGFENEYGLLRGVGVDTFFQTESGRGSTVSSFGGNDEGLLEEPVETLGAQKGPFAAVFIPTVPHYPYDYPGKPAGAPADRTSYLRGLRFADDVLARLLERLGARGALDDTLIVIASDHGESFGEHGTFVHNNGLYEEEAVVPLLFWSADGRLKTDDVLAGRQVDMAPTAADLLGVTDPTWKVQGESLLRTAGPGPAYLATFFDRVNMALVEDGSKMLYDPSDGSVMRYDLRDDPEERIALAVDEETRARVAERLEAFAAHQQLEFAEEPTLEAPSSP